MGALSPLAARLAIMGVTALVTVVIPFFVQERPMLSWATSKFGPRVLDSATEKIVDRLGQPLPDVRPDCPPCPQPGPSPSPDVTIPEPTPSPRDPLPVRLIDTAVDTTVDVTKSTWDRVWGAAKSIISRVVGA